MVARRWEKSPRNGKRFMAWEEPLAGLRWREAGRKVGCPLGLLFGGVMGKGAGEGPPVGSTPGRGLWRKPRPEQVAELGLTAFLNVNI